MSWFLLGAPWDSSASGRGEQAAPGALRAAGLASLVEADLGDASTVVAGGERDRQTGVRALPATVAAARALTASLVAALRNRPGSRPLVVGGDCSLLLGVVPALRTVVGRVGLWFVDGHPDYLDGAASDTGETADMELAVLTGTGAPALVSLAGTVPMIDPSAVVLLGHRTTGLDPASAAEVDRLPRTLHRIAAPELLADPPAAGRTARDLLDGATGTAGGWLHIDLDVLDPSALPAVTYPQPGGPSWEHLAAALAPAGRVAATARPERRRLPARPRPVRRLRRAHRRTAAFVSDPLRKVYAYAREESIMTTATSADGTTIAYDRTGSGPTLLLVTGALTDRSTPSSGRLAELLADRFTVANVDRRGKG